MDESFNFKFTKTEAGWIDFEISYGISYIAKYYFSYVFETPKDFIEWVKEINKGKNGEFRCDAEGWFWYIEYDGENVIISDSLDNDGENPKQEKKQRIIFPYKRNDFCQIIFDSFNRFITDGTYRPEEWEGFDIVEILVGEYEDLDAAVENVADLKYSEIEEELSIHPYAKFILPYITDSDFKDGYDLDSKEERCDRIYDVHFRCLGYDGEKLSNYRV
jgi:hypothetical protein